MCCMGNFLVFIHLAGDIWTGKWSDRQSLGGVGHGALYWTLAWAIVAMVGITKQMFYNAETWIWVNIIGSGIWRGACRWNQSRIETWIVLLKDYYRVCKLLQSKLVGFILAKNR